MSCQTPTAIPNPCTEKIGGQPLNPSGRPLSFTDAIPYRDLCRMAALEERAMEIGGEKNPLSQRVAAHLFKQAEEILQQYRDLVAEHGLEACVQWAAEADARRGL
ncbi:hypothetical protein ABH15_07485 [Methanoculleus taiwanensis]|uniref:Uncharacterized protein n=1 Tax=Methanoculleus taiwanensis TaxID=1550565 RepID=A0A498H1V2_9EURY|nr:hypothetical protein [Methanoculleus taiwanensis]RXE56030.1 hypothetical protein ABH15_07485 [Methanoculleus taiwanensis]